MDEYILPRAIMIWARVNACYVRKLATFRIGKDRCTITLIFEGSTMNHSLDYALWSAEVIRTADIQEWLDVSHIRQKTGTDLL